MVSLVSLVDFKKVEYLDFKKYEIHSHHDKLKFLIQDENGEFGGFLKVLKEINLVSFKKQYSI